MKVKDTIRKPYDICLASMIVRNADQTHNEKGTEEYLTWLPDNDAQSILIYGSAGENITMNMEEQREIIEHVSGFLDGQVPLVCGTGRYDTLNTIEMSEFTQGHGADYVMVIPPLYLNPHKKVVMQHFRDLRETLDVEIMVYNNPWSAGYELNIQEVRELVDDGTIQCIKATHNDPNRVYELKYHCKDDPAIFYGRDYATIEDLLAGADGWLLSFPTVLPRQYHRLQDACFAKDVSAAIAAQSNIQPYIDYFFCDKVNGVPHWQEICKYTLQAQDLDVSLPRKPLDELNGANKRKVEKLLTDMG